MHEDNPLNTPDQRALELQALQLLESRVVMQAREEAATQWRAAVGQVPPPLDSGFAEALDQAAFGGVLASLNLDASRPRVHSTSHWPHTVAGRCIPATLSVFPNPDVAYRYMPVDGTSSYVIQGRFPSARPITSEFSVLSPEGKTIANLSGPDLVVGNDGTFTITIDPLPPAGRRNHLQTNSEAVQVLVRDIMADWAAERPSALTISRVEGPPAPPQLASEALVAQAARSLHKQVQGLIAVTRRTLAEAANTLTSPVIRRGDASAGATLVTQSLSWGHFRLEEDEALVLTIKAGGAAYMSVALSDIWSVTDDVTRRTASFNHTQAIPDADGSWTFVLAAKDPSVHNWLDPNGSGIGVIIARWAGFDLASLTQANPSISARLVITSELPHVLPPGTRAVDATGRREQLAKREHDFAWRRNVGD